MKAVIYARVSTDLQEREETVQSQLEALRNYAAQKGHQIVAEYIDQGYSGATLARPELDRLRDALGEGSFDLILIHSPDRLARKIAYQEILLEEFEKQGVKVEFINYPTDDSPEGKMLLGMQGLFAEYERAKITEKTRRGKLYWARQGALIGGFIPYGYRYVARDGSIRGHVVIDEEKASVVRQMYNWLIEEGLSCRGIAAQLNKLEIPTPKGLKIWRSSTVGRMLKSEAYCGTMYYHRGEAVEPINHRRRQKYGKDTRTSRRFRPKEEWIAIPIPPIIDRPTWEQAQEQLHQNFLHSSRNTKHQKYLVSGLVRCGICGHTYVGTTIHGYRFYHCNNRVPLPGQKDHCSAPYVKADPLEEAVWQAVAGALQQPDVLVQEYNRRLAEAKAPDNVEVEERQLSLALKRIKTQEDRLIDAYKNEVIELDQLKVEMGKLKLHRQEVEQKQKALDQQGREQARLEEGLSQLEDFCEQVSQGIDSLTFEEKQKLLRLVVDHITLEGQKVCVHAVIPMDSPGDFVSLRPYGVL